jgi:hypothetical protein
VPHARHASTAVIRPSANLAPEFHGLPRISC